MKRIIMIIWCIFVVFVWGTVQTNAAQETILNSALNGGSYSWDTARADLNNNFDDLYGDIHVAATIGTPGSGLTFTGQVLTLVLATNSVPGAMSAALVTNLESVITLSGMAADSTDLDTFTGSTIPDSQTIKQALQALETEVETKGDGDLKANGTVALTDPWDVGAHPITALRFISDQTTGTAPFTVASTTVVTNLNADTVDGESASAFQDASAVLDTYASIDPSANVQSVLGAADYAAIRALLDLEAGTDFYSIAGANAAFQPLDTNLTTLTSPTAWRLFYSNGTSAIVELALGTPGTVLTSNGATSAPTFSSAATGDLKADGTVPLTANWDVGAYTITGLTFESDQTTGTAPFTVASTTVCTNLNADLLDGESATAFQDADSNLDTLSSPTAWRLFYSNGTSVLTELTLGADGTYLKSNGATTAPTFDTPSGAGDLKADGTVPLTADWDMGSYTPTALRFISDQTTGTAPFTVASTTVVTNLNADTVDGESASAFQDASAVLDTYAGIDPSANVQSLLGAADYANMRSQLDLEAGTDFYSIAAADAAFQATTTNLDTISSPTAWRIFYSNGTSVLTELALGTTGTVLTSNGTTAAPTFSSAGTGDVTKVGTPVNNQVGIWTGDGTLEGDVDLTFDGDNLIVDGTITAANGLISGASATPTITLSDSDSLDADTGISTIHANATTVTAGAVVSDVTITYKDGSDASGSYTDAIIIDGSDNQVEFQIGTTLQAEDIEYEELAASAKFRSYAVASLGDTATPSVLTIKETTNKCISNYKASGADHVFTMPAAHAGGNIIFSIGDEFQVDIEPNTGDLFYLNGTAMAANEHIQNTADTLGERIVGYCVNINGTLRWMFYSSDTTWVEETP